MFPETFNAPSLVPETPDEEAPAAPEEVTTADNTPAVVERVTVTEHYLLAEKVPAVRPERRAQRRSVSA
jgi:hypothetical protein